MSRSDYEDDDGVPLKRLYPPFPCCAVIPRSEWGAVEPTKKNPQTDCPVLQVGFIATRDEPCKTREECIVKLQELQRHHMQNLGMPDIAYNFIICAGSLVFEGRGWDAKSDKVNPNHIYWDGKSIDIGYIGVFNEDEPPLCVLDTRDNLVCDGIDLKYIDRRAVYFN